MIESIRSSLAAGLMALCCAGPLSAQTITLLQAGPLRSDRAASAEALSTLPVGQSVNLLQMSGGWAQVQVGAATGWVRASQLDLAGADVADVSSLESGRKQRGATAVALGVRTLPTRDTRFALIIGVGEYAVDPVRPVPPLAGSKHDVVSALAMARILQVPGDNITVLRDGAVTHDGVQQAIDDLNRRVQPGDRVFVYWSGHGSRFYDASENRCVETLVPYDLHDISNKQFAQWLKPLADKTDKMLVVYDACHSAGMGQDKLLSASRSLGARITAKAAPSADSCQAVTNIRNRGLDAAVRDLGLSDQDFAYVSSSRSDEVSFDNALTGGLATSSLLKCMSGDARDLDGSGSISVDELAVCAQVKIEASLRPFPQLDPQHLVISGNRSFVPAWFVGNPAPHVTAPGTLTPGSQPGDGGVAAPATPPAQPVRPPVSPLIEPEREADLQTVLEQIHAQRDSKHKLEVKSVSDRLRVGADTLDFSVASSTAGFVYVAMLGSDRKSMYLLFPNDLDQQNRIEAGETMLLPRSSWRVLAQGPRGTDTLLVMVTDGKRDLSALGGGKVGPFSTPLTDLDGRARLQWLLGQGTKPSSRNCGAESCSDAFGSVFLKIEEF